MRSAVLIDANVLALLVIGGTSKSYIADHKNTKADFDADDFEMMVLLLKEFSEIVLVAHVVAETSSLVRQIGEPRRKEIQRVFARFVSESYEIPVASLDGLRRMESLDLGVTDGILLHVCSLSIGETRPTLVTIDGPLTDRARASGYDVINFKREFKS